MLRRFLAYVEQEKLFTKEERVLLALSGGLDSVTLCALLREGGFQFGIAHVNHGLRGEESDAEEIFARDSAKKLNVEFFAHRIGSLYGEMRADESVQSAARRLRYDFLRATARENKYDRIATAHHLDDNVETVLINLLRGTGLSGLRGMLPRQEELVRPLLFATREEIENFAAEKKLAWRHDSSNDGEDYTRNRIRKHLVPLLKELQPGFEKSFADTLKHLHDTELIFRHAIAQQEKNLLSREKNMLRLDLEKLQQLPAAETFLFELIRPFGFNGAQARDVLRAGQSGAQFFSATHRLLRDRAALLITPLEEKDREEFRITHEQHPAWIELERMPGTFTLPASAPANSAYFDEERLQFPLLLRHWRDGDRMRPLGMQQTKKVSDILTDAKASLHEKESTRVLCSGENLIWVIGHRISEDVKLRPETKRVLRITIREPQP